MSDKFSKLQADFNKTYSSSSTQGYEVASDHMSLDSKKAALARLGQDSLIELFKDYRPRPKPAKRTQAPLDQRVTLTVTAQQRSKLENELRSLKLAGQEISMAAYIRAKCLSAPDMQEWANLAEVALIELQDTEQNKKTLETQRFELASELDNIDDDDTVESLDLINKLNEVNRKLTRLLSINTQRSHRLCGRMNAKEAQVARFRAERLCITVSDYLRMVLFDLKPNSAADQHLSLAAKRRFYIAILDVAQSGFGQMPQVFNCSQCAQYLEEIQRLRKENEVFRTFAQ